MTRPGLARILRGVYVALLLAVVAAVLAACTNPRHDMPPPDPDAVAIERERQYRYLEQRRADAMEHILAVNARLEAAAAPICASLQFDPCTFSPRYEHSGQMNAYADGITTNAITLTSAMYDFFDTDAEMAFVLAHEQAHHIADHLAEMRGNVVAGAVIGAILSALLGVDVTNDFAAAGYRHGSVSREAEADYLGMYIAARAGYDVTLAPVFWRRMAVHHPNAIIVTTTHPTTAERFVSMEAIAAEIEGKLATGMDPMPEPPKESGNG